MNSFQLVVILSLCVCIFIYELYLIKLSDFIDTMIYVKLDFEAENTAHHDHVHFLYFNEPGENNIIAQLTFNGHSQCSWDPWGTLCGLAVQLCPCGGVQGQSLKSPNYLKVFKALKQLILDCSIPSKYPKIVKEKFCYLKNKLTYRNKSSTIIFLYSSFFKNHKISFFLLQK